VRGRAYAEAFSGTLRPAPVKDRLRPLAAAARAGRPRADTRWLGRPSTGASGQRAAPALSREQPACAVHRKRKARGYNEGKKTKRRTRHLVAGSQGSVLGVWGSPAAVSNARGARVVLAQVLRRYLSAQVVIGDGAYDREGLLAWLLGCSGGLCAVVSASVGEGGKMLDSLLVLVPSPAVV